MIVKEIYDNLFGINYILAYNFNKSNDFDKLQKILEQKCNCCVTFQRLDDQTDGMCQLLEPKSGHKIISILLKKWLNNGYWNGALSHECFHATEDALESRGIKYNRYTKEVFAYNVDMLVNNFINSKPTKKY